MNNYKYWNKLINTLVMILGVALLIATVLTLTLGKTYQTSNGSILSGVMLGAGAVMVIRTVWWQAHFHGQTAEEITAKRNQMYDERYMTARGKASTVAVFITVLFLAGCGLAFQVMQEMLASWLFIIGALIAAFGQRLLTSVFLRRD